MCLRLQTSHVSSVILNLVETSSELRSSKNVQKRHFSTCFSTPSFQPQSSPLIVWDFYGICWCRWEMSPKILWIWNDGFIFFHTSSKVCEKVSDEKNFMNEERKKKSIFERDYVNSWVAACDFFWKFAWHFVLVLA